MWPLVDQMVRDNPERRPNMDSVVDSFGMILNSLSSWTLTRRLVPLGQTPTRFEPARHLFRALGNTLTFRNPLPTPK